MELGGNCSHLQSCSVSTASDLSVRRDGYHERDTGN